MTSLIFVLINGTSLTSFDNFCRGYPVVFIKLKVYIIVSGFIQTEQYILF